MKKVTNKTYSISESATIIGCNAQTLYRQCRAGNLGRKILIKEIGTHVFKISEKELQAIKARKTQGIRRFCEKPVKKSVKLCR